MTIADVQRILKADLVSPNVCVDTEVHNACGSDMMSDVLACPDEIHCLLTGLINQQVIRTADMMDIGVVVFVRGKCPPEEVVEMARQRDMAVLLTRCRMFSACGRMYESGIGPR